MKNHFLLLMGIFLLSCGSDEESELPPNFEGYTYLPLEVGQERIYRIDSISYDDFTGTIDTVIFFERQLIVDTQEDLSGRLNYRTEVYRRIADSLPWRLLASELRYRGTLRYELNQGGNVFVPLVFPTIEDSRWDVNALNAMDRFTYQYQALHQSYQLDGVRYDSSITVLQKDVLNLIERERSSEVYASGLGLIYRENIELDTDINSGEILRGFKRRQRLIQP